MCTKTNFFPFFKGAAVDPCDKLHRTPLFLASGEGSTDAAQALISAGADVTIKDVDRRSCVRMAVGHTSTMEVLLQVCNCYSTATFKEIICLEVDSNPVASAFE